MLEYNLVESLSFFLVVDKSVAEDIFLKHSFGIRRSLLSTCCCLHSIGTEISFINSY